jgi:hypothetical protein
MCHKNLTNMNVSIFLKTGDCGGVTLTCRVMVYAGIYGIMKHIQLCSINYQYNREIVQHSH